MTVRRHFPVVGRPEGGVSGERVTGLAAVLLALYAAFAPKFNLPPLQLTIEEATAAILMVGTVMGLFRRRANDRRYDAGPI